jgi:hypothetical protein
MVMTHEMVVLMGEVLVQVGGEAGGTATTIGINTEIGDTEAGPEGFASGSVDCLVCAQTYDRLFKGPR